MDRLADIETNRAVHRVLVRHWIDLGKVSIRTTSGVSYIAGALSKLPTVTPELTGETVAEIIGTIRRVPGHAARANRFCKLGAARRSLENGRIETRCQPDGNCAISASLRTYGSIRTRAGHASTPTPRPQCER